jgi:hypothetical protein
MKSRHATDASLGVARFHYVDLETDAGPPSREPRSVRSRTVSRAPTPIETDARAVRAHANVDTATERHATPTLALVNQEERESPERTNPG